MKNKNLLSYIFGMLTVLLFVPFIEDISAVLSSCFQVLILSNICQKHNVIIHKMETNKDHTHYMIETEPNVNLSDLVRTMKSYTAYHVWKLHKEYLSKHFGKEKTFWTDGYFICSIGNVSEKQLRICIENQG